MSDRNNGVTKSIWAEKMIFDANLAEFASRVQTICSLEAGRHLSPMDAFARIKSAWRQLKQSKKNLRIDELSSD
jgi:hypothetical protein